MEKFKSPKGNIRFPKEIKNIKIKSNKSESFHLSRSPNPSKYNPSREFIPNLKKKEEPKIGEKQIISQTKIKSGNIIKKTIVYNIPNKGKGRSLEKVPFENLNNNKKNFDLNKRKDKIKNALDIGRKNKNMPKRHNSLEKIIIIKIKIINLI